MSFDLEKYNIALLISGKRLAQTTCKIIRLPYWFIVGAKRNKYNCLIFCVRFDIVVDMNKDMFFCIRCNNFSPQNVCDYCGAKRLRAALDNDPVYLATKDFYYAGMLGAALKNNGIPFVAKEKHGGILKYMGIGTGIEEHNFFVPISAYNKAKEILDELFKPRVFRLAKNPPRLISSFKRSKRQ